MSRYLEGVEEEPHIRPYWRHFPWRGPAHAVRAFVAASGGAWVVDRSVEPEYSQHVSGYLRRRR